MIMDGYNTVEHRFITPRYISMGECSITCANYGTGTYLIMLVFRCSSVYTKKQLYWQINYNLKCYKFFCLSLCKMLHI